MYLHSVSATTRAATVACVASVLLLTGCAGTPRQFELLPEPYLKTNGGPLLVVDACVIQDALGDDDDYHMVTESKAGARRMVAVASQYLAGINQPVKATLVPFACGVIGPEGKQEQLVRFDNQLPPTKAQRPFATEGSLAGTPEVVDALSVLATAAYARGLEEMATLLARHMGQQPTLPPRRTYAPEEVRAASATVHRALGTDSLVFLGMQGYSQSAGKSAALTTGRLLVGIVTGVASGVAIFPGGSTDGSIITAAAFDLKSGELRRAGGTRNPFGDPKNPENAAAKTAVNGVLHQMMYREVFPAAAKKAD